MAVTKINLKNKLLSLNKHQNSFFISSFPGYIYKLDYPFTFPKLILNLKEPISCLCFQNEKIISGSWHGNLFINEKLISNLNTNIIKAIEIFNNKIFVSCDTKLYILNVDTLQILDCIDTGFKILCMRIIRNELYFGCGVPMLAKYENGFVCLGSNGHETSILGISERNNKIVTCSADQTIRCDNEILIKGNGWIRCIEEFYYADDNFLMKDKEIICKHDDYITGIGKIGNTIVCIGLDGFISVIGDLNVFKEEEDDIDAFLEELKNE
ncbi:hypothetical protein GVAV_000440 [Gurleya vavrai]